MDDPLPSPRPPEANVPVGSIGTIIKKVDKDVESYCRNDTIQVDLTDFISIAAGSITISCGNPFAIVSFFAGVSTTGNKFMFSREISSLDEACEMYHRCEDLQGGYQHIWLKLKMKERSYKSSMFNGILMSRSKKFSLVNVQLTVTAETTAEAIIREARDEHSRLSITTSYTAPTIMVPFGSIGRIVRKFDHDVQVRSVNDTYTIDTTDLIKAIIASIPSMNGNPLQFISFFEGFKSYNDKIIFTRGKQTFLDTFQMYHSFEEPSDDSLRHVWLNFSAYLSKEAGCSGKLISVNIIITKETKEELTGRQQWVTQEQLRLERIRLFNIEMAQEARRIEREEMERTRQLRLAISESLSEWVTSFSPKGHHLQLGSKAGDIFYDQHFQSNQSIFRKSKELVHIKAPFGKVIVGIFVYDLRDDGRGGLAEITAGGINCSNCTIKLKSMRSRIYDFEIKVLCSYT